MPIGEYTLDTLPELTEERRKELAKLDALPADQIDTSDIPELTDEQWLTPFVAGSTVQSSSKSQREWTLMCWLG